MSKLVISAFITLTMIFGPLAVLAAELKNDDLGTASILMYSAEGKRLLESSQKKAKEVTLLPYPVEIAHLAKELEKMGGVRNDASKAKIAELEKKMAEFDKQTADKQLAQFEEQVNEFLIEWKSKGLPELLQRSSSSQLSDLVIRLEKSILKLDLKVKELKDAADEDARKVNAPGGEEAPGRKALKLSHLLEQRKTVLMVILGSVKQAAAQKGAGG